MSIEVEACGFTRLRGPHAGPETYVPLDGWVLCDDSSDPAQRDAVLHLLRSPPSISVAPDLPRHWFTHVALSYPAPIRMFSTQEPWLDRQGVMLLDRTGLAVTEGERILTFGDARAREELLRAASASQGELERVTIRARRTGDLSEETGAHLVRPTYSYRFEW